MGKLSVEFHCKQRVLASYLLSDCVVIQLVLSLVDCFGILVSLRACCGTSQSRLSQVQAGLSGL